MSLTRREPPTRFDICGLPGRTRPTTAAAQVRCSTITDCDTDVVIAFSFLLIQIAAAMLALVHRSKYIPGGDGLVPV